MTGLISDLRAYFMTLHRTKLKPFLIERINLLRSMYNIVNTQHKKYGGNLANKY